MFLEYSQPDPDAQEFDPVEDHETIIGIQVIKPDIDELDDKASADDVFSTSAGEQRELASAGVVAQSTAMNQRDAGSDSLPTQGFLTATITEPQPVTTEARTVATVSPVITDGIDTRSGTHTPVSMRGAPARPDNDDERNRPSEPRFVPATRQDNPRYRTTAEPIRLRWWYWPLMVLTILPVIAGVSTHFVGSAVPINVMMALLAVTGVLASLQMVITSGVRMPAWATFVLVFPMAAGVMGGGALAAALVGPAASLQDLGRALAPGLVPLAVLVAAGVSIRRTWRLWVAVHMLTAIVSTADIVNAFILAK
jgi:hypothetical protein